MSKLSISNCCSSLLGSQAAITSEPAASACTQHPSLSEQSAVVYPGAIRSILVTASGAPDEPGGEKAGGDAEGFHVGVIYARHLSWTVARGHAAFEALQVGVMMTSLVPPYTLRTAY